MVNPREFAPFRNVSQVAYVTTDYDRALAMFAERYDVSEWLHMPEGDFAISDEESARLRIALAYVGDLQLELIQPCGGSDTVYRSPLPDSGFAVRFHHIAQLMETESQLAAARSAAEAAGVPIAMHGTSGEGMVRYFYTDHREVLGHFIEHIWYAPDIRSFFDQVPRN